ncbi:vanin-like protein 2 [Contarinia nasturtii]|uniref:vanin-like protein 2 n=1 Tax=Contarinia nasturtii TaxID=265458 RepID=UPI0012D418B7|nr:vanin-like protein 2 [Contarinia nasturtii]
MIFFNLIQFVLRTYCVEGVSYYKEYSDRLFENKPRMFDQKLLTIFSIISVTLIVSIDGAPKKILIPVATQLVNIATQGKTPISTPIQKTQKILSNPAKGTSTGYRKQSTGYHKSSDPLLQKTILSTLTKPKAPTYKAAVVEVNPVARGDTIEGVAKVTKQVVDIIESKDLNGVDIVVLPEGILNTANTAIPLPNSTLYCDDPNADAVLRKLSCAAQKAKKYVVINLYANEKDEHFSTHLYNMAIVFDRQGTVIAKYRKYHLFGERGVERPKVPDLTTFTTDFGVTFGVAICFDLMFANPMETLIAHGIKNFVYPTYWFSGLPYLSSAQYQQSWAYANNVNLLAANTNAPNIGCSGSGIYSGRSGALEVFVSLTPATKVLIADVPTNVSADHSGKMKPIKKLMANEKLSKSRSISTQDVANFGREDFSKYSMKFLDFSNNPIQTGEICIDDFCCEYSIEVSDLGQLKGKSSYSYAISVFHDLRHFKDKNTSKAGQDVCSLIACIKNSKENCGIMIPISKVHHRYNFKKIQLETKLPKTHMKVMPSTLSTDLQPFQANDFDFKLSEIKEANKYAASLSLNSPKQDLFTFAIFSRDYDRDSA